MRDSSASDDPTKTMPSTAGERLFDLLSARSGFFEGVDDDILDEIKAEIQEFIVAEAMRARSDV